MSLEKKKFKAFFTIGEEMSIKYNGEKIPLARALRKNATPQEKHTTTLERVYWKAMI